MRVLVTGGAGYIGSHAVKALGEKGYELLTYDNLSTGHDWAVLYGDLIVGDLANKEKLISILDDFQPDAVMHFAASILPDESMEQPLKYYKNNVLNTINLLDGMKETGVDKCIFSSSATVYSPLASMPADENAPLGPINPYGWTKVMVEQILHDLSDAGLISYVSLRYFNVAGADPEGKIGQAYENATHLITRALRAASGDLDRLYLFGQDYDTADGTCIRDYIHMNDLAEAHILACEYLNGGGKSEVFNCGYGHGSSNLEIIEAVKKVTKTDFLVEPASRRPGDLPITIANSTKLKKTLDWKPRFDDLELIIKTAWEWEKKLKRKAAV